MKKLYLDIDGVLLTTKNTQPVDGVYDFIDYILSKYDCYWLTTHCREDNSTSLLRMLEKYFPKEIICKLMQVKPTLWKTLKTEAVDFSSDFYWLDDYVFEAEIKILKEKECFDRLIIVDARNTNELQCIINVLKSGEEKK